MMKSEWGMQSLAVLGGWFRDVDPLGNQITYGFTVSFIGLVYILVNAGKTAVHILQ